MQFGTMIVLSKLYILVYPGTFPAEREICRANKEANSLPLVKGEETGEEKCGGHELKIHRDCNPESVHHCVTGYLFPGLSYSFRYREVPEFPLNTHTSKSTE